MKTNIKAKNLKVEEQLEINFNQTLNNEKSNFVEKIEAKIIALNNFNFNREVKDFSQLVITQSRSF